MTSPLHKLDIIIPLFNEESVLPENYKDSSRFLVDEVLRCRGDSSPDPKALCACIQNPRHKLSETPYPLGNHYPHSTAFGRSAFAP
jgi:hypothetical protein